MVRGGDNVQVTVTPKDKADRFVFHNLRLMKCETRELTGVEKSLQQLLLTSFGTTYP